MILFRRGFSVYSPDACVYLESKSASDIVKKMFSSELRVIF